MGASREHGGQPVFRGAQSYLYLPTPLTMYRDAFLICDLISYKSVGWPGQLLVIPFYSWENEAQTEETVTLLLRVELALGPGHPDSQRILYYQATLASPTLTEASYPTGWSLWGMRATPSGIDPAPLGVQIQLSSGVELTYLET